MIYPQHVFVALTGLGLASAAPVRHTTNATAAHALVPQKGRGLELLQNIKEQDYSPECFNSWKIFDASRCWCFTGCALDCSQGGEPGKPGTEVHPQWCQDLSSETLCLELSCDLNANCKDEDRSVEVKGAASRLDDFMSTAEFSCADAPELTKSIAGHIDVYFNPIMDYDYFTPAVPTDEDEFVMGKSYSVSYDGVLMNPNVTFISGALSSDWPSKSMAYFGYKHLNQAVNFWYLPISENVNIQSAWKGGWASATKDFDINKLSIVEL